jgi:hypothetical protein
LKYLFDSLRRTPSHTVTHSLVPYVLPVKLNFYALYEDKTFLKFVRQISVPYKIFSEKSGLPRLSFNCSLHPESLFVSLRSSR